MEDKIIVITGASEGLGKATAIKLADQGANVVLIAHNEDRLKQTADQIAGKAQYFVCDISNEDQIKTAASEILNTYGHIDVLINCAGIWSDEELEKDNPERRRKVLEVNTLGTIEITKAFEPSFREQNKGHVLNVISTSGNSDTSSGDNTLWQTYGASKYAISGFTRAFKDSLQGTNIKVTGFYPGGFDSNLYENAHKTDAHNQPWMMSTDDVADALIFCLTRPDDMLVEKMIVTKFGN